MMFVVASTEVQLVYCCLKAIFNAKAYYSKYTTMFLLDNVTVFMAKYKIFKKQNQNFTKSQYNIKSHNITQRNHNMTQKTVSKSQYNIQNHNMTRKNK